MPTVSTPSGSWFYVEKKKDTDQGIPILLIHGAGSSHLTWTPDLRRLKGRRVIAPDLSGHGKSVGNGFKNVLAHAEVIREIIHTLEIPRVYVAGHSMGGAIALSLALNAPELVAGLILMSTGAKLRVNEKILDASLNDPPLMVDLINKWAWGEDVDPTLQELSTQQLLMTNPQVVHHDYMACNAFNVEDQLKNVRQPALILCGTADKMTPLRLSEKLDQDIPISRLQTFEGAGHMLPLERPTEVATAVQKWLHGRD